jgi:hypothetical protein
MYDFSGWSCTQLKKSNINFLMLEYKLKELKNQKRPGKEELARSFFLETSKSI